MQDDPGATVLIAYYVLKSNGMEKSWFTADYLHAEYGQLLKNQQNKQEITSLAQQYKKRHDKSIPRTFDTAGRLRTWLNQHCDKKQVFWFESKEGSYRVRACHQSRLNNYMP